jgi:hypothetical protein
MQTMPSSIHRHASAVSAAQLVASPCAAQGSTRSEPAGPPPIIIVIAGAPADAAPPMPTLPVPHAQSQGGQAAPGAQVGQVHAHVPPAPAPPPLQAPPPAHVQAHAGQASPGAQSGQAHVHVPPPAPPPVGGFEQSQATAGQSAPVGQAIGCTQVQPPPDASRA